MGGFMRGKVYGTTTVGARGQVVIPADARKALKMKPGDKLIVMARSHGRGVGLIPVDAFSEFLDNASKAIADMEKQVPQASKPGKKKKRR